MKTIIIFHSKSGNTEELANKMKDVLGKSNHECEVHQAKSIKNQLINEEGFLNSYDLLCLGSCVHANSPAMGFKKTLKKMHKDSLKGKKLICFSTAGSPNTWEKTCTKIQKLVPQCEHTGNVGCKKRENQSAIKSFEEIVKKL